MGKNSIKEIDIIKLCNYDASSNSYMSKSGNEYIEALKTVFNLENKNDIPFTNEEIVKQPTLDEYDFEGKNDFIYICKLKANPLIYKDSKRKNEKIIPQSFATENAENIYKNSQGVAYMFTCIIDGKEYIIKFGSTRKTFKERLGSYNCGCVNNWRTASTTNIKILQSFLTTRKEFNLYICDFSKEARTYTWHGVESASFASPMPLVAEDILIKKFIEQFGYRPLANIQADAEN